MSTRWTSVLRPGRRGVVTVALLGLCGSALRGGEIGPDARLRALAGGEDGPPGYEEMLVAARDLVRMGDPAVTPLLDALAASDAALRANAAFALGRLRSSRAVGPLLSALRDPIAEVRAAAAEALGCVGDPRAVDALVAALGRDHELDQRSAAVALGALRARAAIEPLTGLLASANWEVRWRAAVALGQIGETSALPALGALANDRDPVVVAASAWARAAILGKPAPGGLAANLASPDAAVVRASAWALGVIGTDLAVEALRAGLKASGVAPEACRLVLLWRGDGGTATPVVGQMPPRADLPTVDITDDWLDRYGDLEITVSEAFVLSSREAHPERGAHARPRLFRLPAGLFLAFDRADGEAGAESPAVLLRSTDGGRSWQDVGLPLVRVDAVLATGRPGVRLWDCHAFEQAPGTYAFQTCGSEDGGNAFGNVVLATLARSGSPPLRTMSALRAEPYLATSASASRRYSPGLRGAVLECQGGALLAAAETRAQGDAQTRCVSYRSTDKGLAWAGEATIAGDGSAEPALACLPDGRVLALLCDLESGGLLQAWSSDAGQTWVGPVRSGSTGGAPSLCLAAGGVLVCSYTQEGPRLMFSVAPDAKRWTDRVRPVSVAMSPGRGRTSLAEIEPGKLLLAYDDLGSAAGQGRGTGAVMGCEVSVRRAR